MSKLDWTPDKSGVFAYAGWPTATYRIAYMPFGPDASPATSWHAHYEPPMDGAHEALTQRPVDIERAKRLCEQHLAAMERKHAWEQYMLHNDPPELS